MIVYQTSAFFKAVKQQRKKSPSAASIAATTERGSPVMASDSASPHSAVSSGVSPSGLFPPLPSNIVNLVKQDISVIVNALAENKKLKSPMAIDFENLASRVTTELTQKSIPHPAKINSDKDSYLYGFYCLIYFKLLHTAILSPKSKVNVGLLIEGWDNFCNAKNLISYKDLITLWSERDNYRESLNQFPINMKACEEYLKSRKEQEERERSEKVNDILNKF